MSSCRRLPSAAIEAEAEAAVGVGEAEVGGAEGVGAGTAARERGQSGACAWRGRRRRRTTTRHKKYFEIARAYSAVSRTAVYMYFGWGCLRLPCTSLPPHRPPSGTDCSRRPMPHQSASAQPGIGHRSGIQRIPGRLGSAERSAKCKGKLQQVNAPGGNYSLYKSATYKMNGISIRNDDWECVSGTSYLSVRLSARRLPFRVGAQVSRAKHLCAHISCS